MNSKKNLKYNQKILTIKDKGENQNKKYKILYQTKDQIDELQQQFQKMLDQTKLMIPLNFISYYEYGNENIQKSQYLALGYVNDYSKQYLYKVTLKIDVQQDQDSVKLNLIPTQQYKQFFTKEKYSEIDLPQIVLLFDNFITKNNEDKVDCLYIQEHKKLVKKQQNEEEKFEDCV